MNARTPLATTLLGLLTVCSWLHAQVPGCEPSWQTTNTLPGADSVNDAVAWDPDGAGPLPEHIVICGYAGLPIAGYLGLAGNTTHWGVALFNPITEQWSTLGNSPAAPGEVVVRLVVDSNNRLCISTRTTIYRWQQGVWVTLGQTALSTDRVARLIAADNGELFAIGAFGTMSGVLSPGIARFDGSQWQALGQGVVGSIYDGFRRQNGNIVVFGGLWSAGGVAYPGLAEWDGTSWTGYANTPFVNANAATELASGDLVAGSSAVGLHRFDGTTWTSMGVGTGEPLSGLHTRPNGDLIVAGNFITYAGVAARYLIQWDGTTWSTMGSHPDTPKTLRFADMSNGDLLVAGPFKSAGAAAAVNVARWDSNEWHGCGGGFNGDIWVLKRLGSGDILVAGDFTGLATANGGRADRIARFDGHLWHSYGAGLDRIVRDVAELPNGDLVAVGNFLNSGTTALSRVARWDGATWTPMGSGADGNLHAVTSLPNGDTVVGGFTFFIGGVLARHLARWDGVNWHAFGNGVLGSGIGAYGIEALATLPNGDLIAGGPFVSIDNVAADGIARWDGNNWHAMPGGSSGNGTGYVHAMHVAPDGTLFVAANGQFWQWTTTSWLGLGANGGYGNTISCFASLPNGQLLTGNGGTAFFLPQLPIPASNLQRWTPGSTGSTEFATFVPGSVKAMLLEDDGSVLIGGNFLGILANAPATTFSPNPYLVRLAPTCPAAAVAIGAGCLGAAGPATLTTNSAPWLGSTYTATAAGMPANSIAVEVLGNTPTVLPLPLPSTPGCQLLTNPIALAVIPASAGSASTSFLVPSAAAFVGLQLTQQVVALTFQATGLQAVSTNALKLTTGAL
tara:strand:+ start:38017 stop:40557 length:2541 start_codon:yes stop_codon:yes gene_type:complete